MKSTRVARTTEEEFLSLPESLEHVELIDGDVIVMPSPSFRHQEILRRLAAALSVWAERRSPGVTIGLAPTDIRFARGRILQPDAFVIFDRIPLDREGPLDRVPELCVEVLSLDRVYDRLTKRIVYASSGVREYWVVDPAGLVERWHGEALGECEELTERLTSPLLAGFDLDLRRLFAA